MTSKTPTCLPPCGPFGPSRDHSRLDWVPRLEGAALESSQQEQQSPPAGWSGRNLGVRVVGSTGLGVGQTSQGGSELGTPKALPASPSPGSLQ